MTTEIDRAYLAGLIDADGHIGLRAQWSKNESNYINKDVSVASQDPDLMNWLVQTFGGYTKNQRCNGRIQLIVWHLPAPPEKLLTDLLPYLKTKKAQAELLIEYSLLGRGRTAEQRKYFIDKSSELNQRLPNIYKEMYNVSE